MAEIASPLYRLTKKGVHWDWNRECENSYQNLCKALTNNPITLSYPDWDRGYYVEVDASDSAVGGVLAQKDGKGRMRPISFFSSQLNESKRYSAGEREAWAIVATSRRWRKYLEAAPGITILSDHNPLVWMRHQRDPRGKFARWLIELEGLRYDIQYRKGSENLVADYLSRSATTYDEGLNNEEEHLERNVYLVSEEETEFTRYLREEQETDPVISRAVVEINENGRVKSGQLKQYSQMKIYSGLLYRGKRIVVPKSCREDIFDHIQRATHSGVMRTYEDVKLRFFWRGMFLDVQNFCKCCEICLRNKRSHDRKEPLKPIKMPFNFPRALIAMDIAYLPWTSNGYRYVLIIVDLFSKFIEAIPMKNQESATIAEALQYGWFHRYGYPLALLSDQCPNVDGTVIRELCGKYGIRKLHSSAYHPEGDGEAERTIQSFKQTMRCCLGERKILTTDWPKLAQEMSFICNSQINASTKYTPQEIMFVGKVEKQS